MNMLKALIFTFAVATAAPVYADTTAVYRAAGHPFEMRVEVSGSGNVRGTVVGQKAYFLTISGVGYLVLQTPQGPAVERMDDLSIVLREAQEALIAQNPELKMALAQTPTIALKENGTAMINGRVGKAYFFVQADGSLSPRPVAVVTDDPALAELGRAMAHQFEMSVKSNPIAGQSDFASRMLKILRDGTALTFGGGDLDTVGHDTVDPARFILPTTPEPLDQVRARFKANGGHLP